MVEDPDRPLLEAVAEGNENALRELIDRHREKLFRFIYHQVWNEADAAEILAEVFVRVYNNAGKFRPQAKVITWVYSIAGNLCRDFYRKNNKWKFTSLFYSDNNDSSESSSEMLREISCRLPMANENLQHKEELQEVLKRIEKLPQKLKEPFVLHILEEHSQKECGELLGLSEKTIETRVHRARKLLQA